MEYELPAYNIGAVHVKRAAESGVCYQLVGKLFASGGRLLLHVPRRLMQGALDALDAAGVRLPTLEESPPAVEVMSEDELERIGGPGKVSERGHPFHYTLGRVREEGGGGKPRFWYFQVHSPELAELRISYGLPSMPQRGFRLVFACRPPGVLAAGPVSKIVEASVPLHFEDPFWPLTKRAARGIPDPHDFGDLAKLQLGDLVDFVVQHHLAERAGPHYDVRLGTPNTGLFSWATRKGLPIPGQRAALFRQPLHAYPYKDFQGRLRGYGAGVVKRHEGGKALVTKVSPQAIHFTLAHRVPHERFVLFHPEQWGPDQWLLLNVTPRRPLGIEKGRYALLDERRAEELLSRLEAGAVVQPKVDGASTHIELGEKGPELYSPRVSKRSGLPIVYTERVFGGAPVAWKLPKELTGMVLRGELYAVRQHDDGTQEVLPVEELTALLNARLERSLARQRAQKLGLRVLLFDVDRGPGGKPAPESREERVALLRRAMQYLPEAYFGVMPEVRTPDEAKQLWRDVVEGRHPLTREGVIIHPPIGQPRKLKSRQEIDVYIRRVFPGDGKHRNRAGGFEYSLEPDGPIVGRVGTGLSDELRQAMWDDPDEFVGRRARVVFQEQTSGGSLRAPSLLSLHEG